MLGGWDIAIIVFLVVVVIVAGIYFLNRWASKRMVDQQSMIERHRQPASIYVIDKKRDKITNANFPKVVQEQVPRWNKLMKMYLVKAKIGPQIATLMCDKEVFNALPLKKTVKVDMAGIYIVSMKGMKSKKEMAAQRKSRGAGSAMSWVKGLVGR